MLAVFDKSVAKSPEGLRSPAEDAQEKTVGGASAVLQHFSETREGVVTIRLGSAGSLAFSSENQNPVIPRLFAVVDDIFCLFEGHIENIPHLKQQYGLTKTANEVIIIIEAYRSLRDRGPYPADQVVRDINGKFAFILFDSSCKSTFIAAKSGLWIRVSMWGSSVDMGMGNMPLLQTVPVPLLGFSTSPHMLYLL